MEVIHYMKIADDTDNILKDIKNLNYQTLFSYVRNKNPTLSGLTYYYEGCYAFEEYNCKNRE